MIQPLVWAEVDLGAIAHNVRELRRITRPRAQLMVAVKANGYGHGAVKVARTALANGATQLGVARIEEGIALREAGLSAPILVFGYTAGALAPVLIENNLTATVFSLENAREMSAAAGKDRSLDIHLKVDTGMGRLGMLPGRRAVEDIAAIAALERLNLSGLWTHYAASDERDKSHTQRQLERFKDVAEQVRRLGISIEVHHTANSGAIIDLPETHMDMVRAGISVYGLYPSRAVRLDRIDLRPAMALKARIVHVKRVQKGTPISYGCTWRAPKPTTIATIAVGYGDGYSRQLSNKGTVLVRGQEVPIVGRVCMDLTMIDVGDVTDVQTGDEAVMFGRQGDARITADAVADCIDTINYEITTSLTDRVPRLYCDTQGSETDGP